MLIYCSADFVGDYLLLFASARVKDLTPIALFKNPYDYIRRFYGFATIDL
ncbi:hypothetical protein [Brevibacillus halotolerans]|nr:hypothetical protein [Brevibacillus halotolerans]MBA4533118.1 hypothetical protein [Brevibacillus halotolerans]